MVKTFFRKIGPKGVSTCFYSKTLGHEISMGYDAWQPSYLLIKMDLKRFHHETGPKGFVGIYNKRIDFQNTNVLIELSY